jgi:type IV pilus assembly protein PilM
MANLFENIFSKISGGNNNSVIGVDIGSSSIKVVQLKKKAGKAVLQTYGEIALGPYAGIEIGRATKLPAEKIAEAMLDLLKEANVSTPDAAMSIPMRSSMVSVFKMPDMKSQQLAQMVPIEARKYIPVPIAEVSMDWFVIPKIEDEEAAPTTEKIGLQKFQEVMTVAIHNDILNDFNLVVNKTGLKTSFFEVEMFSTARSVLEPGYLMPVMIVDIGAGATKVYITERGVVRDSHIIGKGSQDITLAISKSLGVPVDFAEKLKRSFGANSPQQDEVITNISDITMNPIFTDANNILLKFQKEHNKNVSMVLLTGGGALLKGLPEKAQQKFGIQTLISNPFDKVETPAFLEGVLQQTGVMFAGAIGLAMRKLQELD